MNETLEIELHLECAVPVLKCEHSSPVQPEGRIEYFLIEDILNCLIVQVLILCHEQLHDLHAALLTQIEASVGMCVFTAILCGTAQRVVWIMLVQPVILIKDGYTRRFD